MNHALDKCMLGMIGRGIGEGTAPQSVDFPEMQYTDEKAKKQGDFLKPCGSGKVGRCERKKLQVASYKWQERKKEGIAKLSNC